MNNVSNSFMETLFWKHSFEGVFLSLPSWNLWQEENNRISFSCVRLLPCSLVGTNQDMCASSVGKHFYEPSLFCRYAQRQKKIPSFGTTGPSGPCRTHWPYRLSIRRLQRISFSSLETVSRNERPGLIDFRWWEIRFLKWCEVPLEKKTAQTALYARRAQRSGSQGFPASACFQSLSQCLLLWDEWHNVSVSPCRGEEKQRAERELWGKKLSLKCVLQQAFGNSIFFNIYQ